MKTWILVILLVLILGVSLYFFKDRLFPPKGNKIVKNNESKKTNLPIGKEVDKEIMGGGKIASNFL